LNIIQIQKNENSKFEPQINVRYQSEGNIKCLVH